MTTQSKDLTEALTFGSEALINAAVSERTSEDTWSKLVKFAVAVTSSGSDLSNAFAQIEAKYKADFSVGSLPSKYRSAKSSVMGALACNIALLDEEGSPRGKSAVERDTRAIIKATAASHAETAVKRDAQHYIAMFDGLLLNAAVDLSAPGDHTEWNKFVEYTKAASSKLATL